MNVLHVIPAIARRYGGPSSMIRSLCSELARRPGVEVELATTDADGAGGRIDRREIPQDYAVHLFRRDASETWKYSSRLGGWLRENVGRFDVVHVHALWSYASVAAARAAVRADVPYILRPAGMLSEYSLNHGAWKKRLSWTVLEKSIVAKAAAFHVTSSAESEDVRRLRPDARVWVIPNGVPDEAFSAEPSRSAATGDFVARSIGGRRFVLFLSRLHPKKGIVDLLLPAWAQVQTDAVLAIAGGEDAHQPDYARQVRAEIERLGLGERVRLLGEIGPQDRWPLYDDAALFVLPSHSENFGIVVAEAMARGCPVVVTDQVQAAEHVRAANAGVVIPPTVSSLTAALQQSLDNASLRCDHGEAGRRYACSHFRWSAITDRVRRMYEATLDHSTAGQAFIVDSGRGSGTLRQPQPVTR